MDRLIFTIANADPSLSADKKSFNQHKRMTLICPCCKQPIGFVSYKIEDLRVDNCPKCKGLFKYVFDVQPPVQSIAEEAAEVGEEIKKVRMRKSTVKN